MSLRAQSSPGSATEALQDVMNLCVLTTTATTQASKACLISKPQEDHQTGNASFFLADRGGSFHRKLSLIMLGATHERLGWVFMPDGLFDVVEIKRELQASTANSPYMRQLDRALSQASPRIFF